MMRIAALACALVFSAAQAAIARPGDLRSASPISAPANARAWRVVYETTSLAGAPREVSGVVFVPNGPAPAGGRNVVSWAHPTTGIDEGCAPSTNPGLFASIPNLDALLSRGYIVAATDYPGLGTPGMHPYLVGVSEARSVIDIVRAVHDLLGAGASRRYVAWGHSQGAQGVLFVNQIAKSYAPDVQLVGVVAAAPPTSLERNLRDVFGTVEGRLLASYMLVSWSSVYDKSLDPVVHSPAIPIVRSVARQCAITTFQKGGVMLTARLLTQHMLLPSFWTNDSWVSAADENSPDPQLAAAAPLLIAQGTDDTVATPAITQAFVQAACRAGASIDFVHIDGGGHPWAAFDSADAATSWIGERFAAAKAVPGECTTRHIPALQHPAM